MKIVNKNLLRNSAKCYSLTKSTTSPVYANFNMQDVSDEIIGKTITLSVYVKSSGGSEALPSPSDMVGRFGMHTTEFWEDTDGTKSTTYQSTALLSSWGKDERVKATYTITRPAGKPTARLIGVEVRMQATCKPNSENNATWIIGYPKAEFGAEATDYSVNPLDNPAYMLDEDMFEQGTASENAPNNSSYEGMKSNWNNRIRSKYLIPVNTEKIAVRINQGYSYFILEFNNEKYLGVYTGWQSEDKWHDLDPRTTQIALIFKKDNDPIITPSEIARICGGGVGCMSTKATASISLTRINDGIDAFTIVYDTPTGFEFTDTVKSITITAKIFKGGKELTDSEVGRYGAIKWYQAGNAAAIGTGKMLTLTAPKEVYATLEN